ncbi:protoporphyrinogen oxidase [Bacillus sp. TS-2]|nr:protoporphyrinogen oxidase [Bacillus sp. TS-2]
MNAKRKVAIIGGGLTGLAAAFKLQSFIDEGQDLDYDLFESTDRLGGKIQTVQKKGFVIEKGPDSFLARKKSMSRLAEEVGLADELVFNETGQAYIMKKNQLHPIPKGSVMGIPTDFNAFISSPLLSPFGKLSILKDFILPTSTQEEVDVSAGSFFRKRLGNEAVESLIEPLLSGIYAGDMDKLSLKATFPQFQQLEKSHRSLIKGTLQNQKQQKALSGEKVKKNGAFLTFKRGLESFVDAIVQRLPESNIKLQHSVQNITKRKNDYEIVMKDGRRLYYKHIIITTPPQVSGQMLNSYKEFDYLRKMDSSSAATVALAFKEEDVKNPYEGTGFVVSRKNDVNITACTWTDKKWPHTTPKGYTLLRSYVGKAGESEIVDQSDDEIVQTVLKDLNQVIHIKAQPLFSYVTRWKNGMPQYYVGHPYKIEKLKDDLRRNFPGLYIVGAGIDGVGLPDCIDQGEYAAAAILKSYQ